MNKCRTCAKEKLCEKEEDRENCRQYVKEPYTTIVIKENGIKEIRRID